MATLGYRVELPLGKMPAMTKRRLVRWSLILAILAAFAVWLEPMRVVWGWLRGEGFLSGKADELLRHRNLMV